MKLTMFDLDELIERLAFEIDRQQPGIIVGIVEEQRICIDFGEGRKVRLREDAATAIRDALTLCLEKLKEIKPG